MNEAQQATVDRLTARRTYPVVRNLNGEISVTYSDPFRSWLNHRAYLREDGSLEVMEQSVRRLYTDAELAEQSAKTPAFDLDYDLGY